MISSYMKTNTTKQSRVLGQFMVTLHKQGILFKYACIISQSWLVTQTSVYAMKLPTPFQLIGQIVSLLPNV